MTTRIALDRLRRARTERAHYPGPWLPEPLAAESEQPEAQLEHAESLTLTFLLLLERLGAGERAAFLPCEVFDYSHAETAAMLEISEDACRQRVHRAKQRLREDRPRQAMPNIDIQQRLYVLQAWREAPFYSARERAALAWCEAVTRLDPIHGVPDDVYEQARAEFSEEQLIDLNMAIILINGWNRIAVPSRADVGSYKPPKH